MSQSNKNTIPKGWRRLKIRAVADITNGKTNTQDAVENGEYPLFDRSALIKRSNKFLFDRTAVILPGEGAEFIPRYYSGKFDLHQRAYAIFPKTNRIEPKYLFYAIYASRNILSQNSVGSTVKSLRLPIIQSVEINVPILKEEQQKIADILSSMDAEIEAVDKEIVATERLKRGLMQDLLTRGIGHTKFKKTEVGEVPEEWEVIKMGKVATLQRGFDLPSFKRISGAYFLVSSNGITDTHNEYQVKGPGVITGRSGTIGNVFYVEGNFWPLNTTLYVKDFHGNHEKFVYYFLQNRRLGDFHTGTGVPTLNRNIVHEHLVSIPKDFKEQKKIAEILSSVDNKLLISRQLKQKFLHLKKGLMQDLLSGRVRVNLTK